MPWGVSLQQPGIAQLSSALQKADSFGLSFLFEEAQKTSQAEDSRACPDPRPHSIMAAGP